MLNNSSNNFIWTVLLKKLRNSGEHSYIVRYPLLTNRLKNITTSIYSVISISKFCYRGYLLSYNWRYWIRFIHFYIFGFGIDVQNKILQFIHDYWRFKIKHTIPLKIHGHATGGRHPTTGFGTLPGPACRFKISKFCVRNGTRFEPIIAPKRGKSFMKLDAGVKRSLFTHFKKKKRVNYAIFIAGRVFTEYTTTCMVCFTKYRRLTKHLVVVATRVFYSTSLCPETKRVSPVLYCTNPAGHVRRRWNVQCV